MLASKLLRASQRVSPGIQATAVPGTQLIKGGARTHQRRRSSSKASCPPDSSDKPTPAKATAPTETVDGPSQVAIRNKRTSKYRRPSPERSLKAQQEENSFAYADLPAVPTVNHLDLKDLNFSSFFSLHRPLSLTTPFPQAVTDEAFAAIFEPAVEEDPWANGNSAERRPEDVIYTLNQKLETINDAIASASNEVVHIDVLTDPTSTEEGTKHLDTLPRGARVPSLEEIVAQVRPYQVPPPPQPFVEEVKASKKRVVRQSRQAKPRTNSYTTTITVEESTHANGETTYSASISPIVRVANASHADSQHREWTPYRRRHIEHTAPSYLAGRLGQRHTIRAPATRHRARYVPSVRKPVMMLISVKRQRKLKMKKHKYKKLMKRTRNLRRKLEKK